MRAYTDWLTEMFDNNRSVQLFSVGELDMSRAIHGVNTRKGALGFGRKVVDNNALKSEMNRLSRDSNYTARTVEFKLFDLFYRASTMLVRDRYENIN